MELEGVESPEFVQQHIQITLVSQLGSTGFLKVDSCTC